MLLQTFILIITSILELCFGHSVEMATYNFTQDDIMKFGSKPVYNTIIERNVLTVMDTKELPRQLLSPRYRYMKTVNDTEVEAFAEAELGLLVKAKYTTRPPGMLYYYDDFTLYTLVMIDRDSPSTTNFTYNYWLHWLVVNIPEAEIFKGEVIAEYVGPWPQLGTGKHRYIFYLFRQDKLTDFSQMKKISKYDYLSRRNFNVKAFYDYFNFTEIDGSNVFRSEWDESVDENYGHLIK